LWPPLVPVTHPAPSPPKVVGHVSAVTVFTVPVGNCAEALKHPKTENKSAAPMARHKRVRIKIPSTLISLVNPATCSQCKMRQPGSQNVENHNLGKARSLEEDPQRGLKKTKCISTFVRNKIFCILNESGSSVNCF
jgi:hypothetical protein